MIKLAICDDEEKELDRTKRLCESILTDHPEFDINISAFSSPSKLLEGIRRGEQFDILLLDIYMPEQSGVELARILRETDMECQIVFLTTSTAHAIEAFSLHAAHYLVKPYTSLQLKDALLKALSAVERNQKAQITIKVTGGLLKLAFKDFIYSETERHNQRLHLYGNKIVQVRMSSSELYDMLSGDDRFFKCGSTYIINLDMVEEITAKDIIFENGEKLPILRRLHRELLNEYTKYSLKL